MPNTRRLLTATIIVTMAAVLLTGTITAQSDDAQAGEVTLLYPVNVAVNTNAPELQWLQVPDADYYEVRLIGSLQDDTPLLLAEERYAAQFEAVCLEGVCQVTSPAAITVPEVAWQVRAGVRSDNSAPWADASGVGPWSQETPFMLAEGARSIFSDGVPQPMAIGPRDSTEKLELELDPNFRWTHQPEATGYTLVLFYREEDQLYPLKTEVYELNSSLRNSGIDCSVADSCIAEPILPLTKDVDYTWGVRAEFGDVPGPWSELLRFEMIPAAAFRFEFAEYADIELTLESPPRRAPVPGDVIPLIVDIENIGPQRAETVEVALEIPDGLIYFWDTSALREYDPDDGVWLLEVLPQHTTDQLTLYVEAIEAGEYTIEAEVMSYDAPVVDPDGEAGDGLGDDADEVRFEVVRAPVAPNNYPFGFNPDLLNLGEGEE